MPVSVSTVSGTLPYRSPEPRQSYPREQVPYPSGQPRQSGPQVQSPRPQYPPQPRPEPVSNGLPPRTVDERHLAFTRAAEALHDRHYEDNSIRLEAELRLAEFFLA
jgi:hypothetical protein